MHKDRMKLTVFLSTTRNSLICEQYAGADRELQPRDFRPMIRTLHVARKAEPTRDQGSPVGRATHEVLVRRLSERGSPRSAARTQRSRRAAGAFSRGRG